VVIAALSSFAFLLIAWIVAPSGEARPTASGTAPSVEIEAQPALAEAA
jgi:hypothetical protein